MTSHVPGDFPSAALCAPTAVLALGVLADLRRWADRHPVVATAPLEAMAMTAAVISPWRTVDELRLAARMYAWTYALDDHVEQDITTKHDLDDLLRRCNSIVRTGEADVSQPLLSVLSEWQAGLGQQPLYPPLSGLLMDKFAAALVGIRYDWVAGQARANGEGPSDPLEYLDHADSVLAWLGHLPRWVTPDQNGVLAHLGILTCAVDDVVVAIRLANDLATYSWERAQPGQNNILMYDITPDRVRAELTRRTESARRRLAPLVARGLPAALEVLRLLDWSVAFYDLADFRGWGSDAPIR